MSQTGEQQSGGAMPPEQPAPREPMPVGAEVVGGEIFEEDDGEEDFGEDAFDEEAGAVDPLDEERSLDEEGDEDWDRA